MSLSISQYGDNTAAPFARAETYIPDQLIAGNLKLVTEDIVVSSGSLVRGTILGQVSSYSVETAAGTNTGIGTIGSVSPGADVEFGAYTLTAVSATEFSVTTPEGVALATEATVGAAYASTDINFTLTAGSTAFVVGDSFTVTVIDSIGNFIKSVSTATDGSQTPCAVLVDDVDASAGPAPGSAYVMGQFNVRAITYDTSWTPALLRTALRPYAIYLKTSVSAADPS